MVIGVPIFDQLLRLQQDPSDALYALLVAVEDAPDTRTLVRSAGLDDKVIVFPSSRIAPGQVRVTREPESQW